LLVSADAIELHLTDADFNTGLTTVKHDINNQFKELKENLHCETHSKDSLIDNWGPGRQGVRFRVPVG
jgi:hypothetical protein